MPETQLHVLYRGNFNHLSHHMIFSERLCYAEPPKAEFLLQNCSFGWPTLDINLEMYSWDTFHYKCFHYLSQLPCSVGFHWLSSHALVEYRFNLCYNSIRLNKTWWVHPIVIGFIATDTRFPFFHIPKSSIALIHWIYFYPHTLSRSHLHSV